MHDTEQHSPPSGQHLRVLVARKQWVVTAASSTDARADLQRMTGHGKHEMMIQLEDLLETKQWVEMHPDLPSNQCGTSKDYLRTLTTIVAGKSMISRSCWS